MIKEKVKIRTKLGQDVEFLSDNLPYGYYDKKRQLYLNQDSIGFVLSVMPLVGVSGNITKELCQLFDNILLENTNIQFLLVASKKTNFIIDKWLQTRVSSPNLVLQKLSGKRANFFKNNIERKYDFSVLISFSQNAQNVDQNLMEATAILKERFKLILTGARDVSPEELIYTLKEFSNPNDDGLIQRFHPLTSIKKQIISSDTEIEILANKIEYSGTDKILKSYIVDSFPMRWDLESMIAFLGSRKANGKDFNCPFLIHFGVNISTTEALKNNLIFKGQSVQRAAGSIYGNLFPSIKKEAEEWKVVNEQISNGERPVQCIMQVCLLTTKSDEDRDSQALESLFSVNGFKIAIDKYFQFPAFLSMLPMSFGTYIDDLKYFRKLRTTLSSELVDLLPIQAEWKGTETPCMLLSGRLGQISYFNPFDNKDGNFNMCISGSSGSGKSVLMQELITAQLGLGAKVFVLDLGRSYQKICDLLGGEFLDFNSKTQINLNPFLGIDPNNNEQIEESLNMFKQVLRTMAAPNCGTDDLENAFLNKALNYVWENYKEQGSVDQIADFLSIQKHPRARELGEKLYPYTSKDTWGKYFKGASKVNFDKDFVVIELQGLLNSKELQSVILQMFAIEITNQLLLGDRQRPFLLVIDEAWNLMNNKATGDFIGQLARTVRKCNGALILATQDIKDFETSSAAEAALKNSDWVCFLPQFVKAENPETGKTKSDKFTLDQNLAGLINSLAVRKGQYSEFVIMKKGEYTVQKLILDPFSRVLYSTSADEFTAVMNLQKQGFSVADAVEIVENKIYGDK